VPTIPASTVNYTVTVECTLTPATEGSNDVKVFQITATENNATAGNFAVEPKRDGGCNLVPNVSVMPELSSYI